MNSTQPIIIHDCQYYDSVAYNNKLSTVDFNFGLFHSNIRSIQKNFDDFKYYVETLNNRFSVIGLSETWTYNNDDNAHLYAMKGYSGIFSSRSGKGGGGVCVFIDSNFIYKVRHDLSDSIDENIFESNFIELSCTNGPNIVVGNIYRPPGNDILSFQNALEGITTKINRENKLCYLMGDFNINLLHYDQHQATGNFLDNLVSDSFESLIDMPTRVSDHSATLIDLSFTNSTHELCPGILLTDMSDHFSVFVLANHSKQKQTNMNSNIRKIDAKNILSHGKVFIVSQILMLRITNS